jgi:hypothetical protein
MHRAGVAMKLPVFQFCLLLAIAWLPNAALAFVEANTPLSKIAGDSQVVVLARVEQVDRERFTARLKVEETLAGPPSLAAINLRLRGNEVAEHGVSPLDLAERIEPGTKLVFFIANEGQLTYAYARGTWFHLSGSGEGPLILQFQNSEPFLRQAYVGDIDTLAALVRDHAAGKGSLPEVDTKVAAGLGPKIGEPEESTSPVPSTPSTPRTLSDGGRFEFPAERVPDSSDLPFQPGRGIAVTTLLALGVVGLLVMLVRSKPSISPSDESGAADDA